MIKKVLLIMVLGFLMACEDNTDKDTEKPVIDLSVEGVFPLNCDTVYFDEPFTLRLGLMDNKELGSFSIDVHNNFDHHSHTTEVSACSLDPKKTPVNPFVLIKDFAIPDGLTDYLFEETLLIEGVNGNGAIDDGDYHLYLKLTDKTGWSTQRGLGIKVLYR